ncbi:hypothetical protein CU098_002386 [Rhizopus stolonifer]|uniref:Uncharacterized protein n=1 Tax=Rhizopus stolonifer TaxID=4846 RepID=A0A367IKX0_RHIST|nr:hypothetical protein CU098_002386 [Rhizopus stolonifer]
MMLPQFGFIVAQAGADSHTLPNTNPSHNNSQGSSLAPLLTSIHKPTSFLGQVPFYSRQPSPAPPPPPPAASTATSLLPPLLPPPAPYLYNKMDHAYYLQQQTPPSSSSNPRYAHCQQEEEQEEELFDRWQGQYNDLMTWMDNEFWEQADEIYQEKVNNLQEELEGLQKGTHKVYQELISDIELKRQEAVMEAESFMNYQLVFIEKYFNHDIQALEEEYESEKKQIQEGLIASLEDRRKQIKEESEQDEGKSSKRKLRKRNNDAITLSTPTKDQANKKRAVRPNTLPNIYSISPEEEDELEDEFSNMKRLINTSLMY